MEIREIVLDKIEWGDPHGGSHESNRRVTFGIRTRDDAFSQSVWLENTVEDKDIVSEARSKLHDIFQSLANQTKSWAKP